MSQAMVVVLGNKTAWLDYKTMLDNAGLTTASQQDNAGWVLVWQAHRASSLSYQQLRHAQRQCNNCVPIRGLMTVDWVICCPRPSIGWGHKNGIREEEHYVCHLEMFICVISGTPSKSHLSSIDFYCYFKTFLIFFSFCKRGLQWLTTKREQ